MTKYFKVEKQILKLVGSTVRFFDQDQNLLARADQKGFKLREEVIFYADEAKTSVLFSVKARQIIDFSPTFDISKDGQLVGSLKREGLASSFVADKWQILDPAGNQIGSIEERNQVMAVLRRFVDFVSLFSPQVFEVNLNNILVGTMEQNKNPFTLRLICNFESSYFDTLGNDFAYAIPAIITMIEGRQG